MNRKYYVYGYVRESASDAGPVGSFYYVGKGSGRRAYQSQGHFTGRPKSRESIKIIAENMNEIDAFQAEVLLISLYGRIDINTGCLRNLSDGGEGVKNLSNESIKKRVASRSGWTPSAETREKMRKICTGRVGTATMRAKVSEALRNRVRRPETFSKISAAKRGKLFSDEHKRKLSEAARRRWGIV